MNSFRLVNNKKTKFLLDTCLWLVQKKRFWSFKFYPKILSKLQIICRKIFLSWLGCWSPCGISTVKTFCAIDLKVIAFHVICHTQRRLPVFVIVCGSQEKHRNANSRLNRSEFVFQNLNCCFSKWNSRLVCKNHDSVALTAKLNQLGLHFFE